MKEINELLRNDPWHENDVDYKHNNHSGGEVM